jgi:hypothetical protein
MAKPTDDEPILQYKKKIYIHVPSEAWCPTYGRLKIKENEF